MTSDRYELRILGAPDLKAPDGRRVASVLSQPSRLGLLSYLTLASGPVTRAAVVADFWPESDEASARNALSQALFYLRRSLGKDTVQSVEGDRLWVPPERLWCDARELLSGRQPSTDVVAAAADDLLAGWNAEGSQPLQEWLDTQRRRVRERASQLVARQEREPEIVAARPAADEPDTAPSPPGRGWRRWSVALGLVLIAGLAVAPLVRREPPVASTPDRLAVLLPRVTATSTAPDLAELTLNAALIARLPRGDGLELVSAPYANSLRELARQLSAIGTAEEDLPEWILDVGVVVTDEAAHVDALLYSGSGLGVRGRVSFDQPLREPDAAVIDVPRAIAERVAEMVAGAVGG